MKLKKVSIDDSVLVKQCQNGDSAAMEWLIVKYQDRIFNVIMKICGNKDDAAELTQETFVKFIQKIGSFKGNSAFYTWLFRIAINLTYNFCNRRVKIRPVSLDSLQGSDNDNARSQLKAFLVDSKEADPTIVAQKKEVVQIVQAAIAQLDDDHRIVIVMRDIENMTYAEIAEVLDVQLGTVKSRLSRARINLREILETVL